MGNTGYDYKNMNFSPKANNEAIVTSRNVRFTVLTSRLIRIEYSPINIFEDRASQLFWYRKQPVPEFDTEYVNETLKIQTEHLKLIYCGEGEEFSQYNLSICLKDSNTIWKYGDPEWMHNLKGTARTLDGINGSVQLDHGLISKLGWSVIDDSGTIVFNDENWIERRFSAINTIIGEKTRDLYFFGYGNNFKECLKDFCKISGSCPMIPRYTMGNWWSRYWEYDEKSLLKLMDEFKEHEIPLSVCVIDMDWHIVKNKYTDGWTGYTWNKKLFPNPKNFLVELHAKGLKTALNLHPSSGIYPHEEAYAEISKYLGNTLEDEKCIPFDCTNPEFISAYFRFLHHPNEDIGVDFWWMDWQQGSESKLPGLDPLRWLNHLHYFDLGRDINKRPFIFSRYGGIGSHRYPIGFSGDSHITWESLAFQPYFTSNATNVGFGWWSHDIGGHMEGTGDTELFVRWLQFGVLSPIMRLHSTKNIFNDKLPWSFDESINSICKEYLQLRHSLIPYLYSMMWRNYKESVPLCLPMYYENPSEDAAYCCPQQYYFGSELIVTPYTAAADPLIRLSRQTVWLPEGEWYDFFTGEYFEGNKFVGVYGDLSQVPIFAKGGAIIPLDSMKIIIFPGADNSFELYEDDGISQKYTKGDYVLTVISQKLIENSLEITIEPANGNLKLIPEFRDYTFNIKGIINPDRIQVTVNNEEISSKSDYDNCINTLNLNIEKVSANKRLKIRVESLENNLISKSYKVEKRIFKILKKMNIKDGIKEKIYNRVQEGNFSNAIKGLSADLNPVQARAVLETLYKCEFEQFISGLEGK